jgi:methyl-accepting chemotaxis protein
MADKAGDALDTIIGSIEEAEERADEIAAASEEQSTTSEEIAQSIQSISTAAQESAAGVTQVAGAAEDLESVTDRLGANVEQFDLGEGAGGEKSHVGQGDPEAPPQASSPQASSRASRDYGGDGHPSSKASL